MRIITYLAFTLLSIVIQFCVMDYIQEKAKLDYKLNDLNLTSQKKRLSDILKEFNHKPHALFYRTNIGKLMEKHHPVTKGIYENMSLVQVSLETTTALTSSILDVLYDDDNSTTTEYTITTESLFTSSEFDNVTDITFFDKKNKTAIKPVLLPKRHTEINCDCNLLYNVCDINCCCDHECTEVEHNIFECVEDIQQTKQSENFCYSQNTFHGKTIETNSDSLFCIVKTNLPDKRNLNHYNKVKNEGDIANKYFKWYSNKEVKDVELFPRKTYKFGDPLWVLKNGSVYYIDLPINLMNNYCTGRMPIKFLKEEKINCNVKLTDLEIFHILNNLDEASLISVTGNSLNSSALNCSTLHCTNWSIFVCEGEMCVEFNKSLHEPLCNDTMCADLVLKVDYIFYYYESKIINATIRLHTEKVFLNIPYMVQEINVMFYLANKSIDQIVEFSGNPGYVNNLPVIKSFIDGNYTESFFNNTSKRNKYIQFPRNKNGFCVSSNMEDEFVLFGVNKRVKCRYEVAGEIAHNDTNACNKIQNNINDLIGIRTKTKISPHGNPYTLKDEDWISMQRKVPASVIQGDFNAQKAELVCHNLVTTISIIFTFADVSDDGFKRENKIVTAAIETWARNVTFNMEDITSTIVTFDTMFIDITKPSEYEYAAGPHLHIHLPKDFFFPFPSNKSYSYKYDVCIILICIAALFTK